MYPWISHRRLHFPWLRNRRTHLCHYNGSTFTHLYIKGTPRSPQGRISLISKPPFLTSTDLSVRVSAGTHTPPSQYVTDAFPPPSTIALKKHWQPPSDQVWSHVIVQVLYDLRGDQSPLRVVSWFALWDRDMGIPTVTGIEATQIW